MKFPVELLTTVFAAFGLIVPGVKNLFRSKKQKDFLERELLENALKHLYDCDSKGLTPSSESLAGALQIRQKVARELLEHLEVTNLIKYEDERLSLTQEGRGYALKVIRIHRLWESYLADKTGVSENDWHQIAEEREHQLTDEEVDDLAVKLGNPLYDPHGDPIPDKEGNIPPAKGILLRDVEPGATVKIFHIEDEPAEVYEQITAEKIYPGLTLRIIDNKNGKIYFVANGEERVFTRLLSGNISVVPIPASEMEPEIYTTLDKVGEGFECEIHKVSKIIRGQQRRRLMDLGFVPGSRVSFEMSSASGDPVAFRVKGAVAALRLEQARQIFVTNVKKMS